MAKVSNNQGIRLRKWLAKAEIRNWFLIVCNACKNK